MTVNSLDDESLIWILAIVSYSFYIAHLSAFSKCGGREKITLVYHIPLVFQI